MSLDSVDVVESLEEAAYTAETLLRQLTEDVMAGYMSPEALVGRIGYVIRVLDEATGPGSTRAEWSFDPVESWGSLSWDREGECWHDSRGYLGQIPAGVYWPCASDGDGSRAWVERLDESGLFTECDGDFEAAYQLAVALGLPLRFDYLHGRPECGLSPFVQDPDDDDFEEIE